MLLIVVVLHLKHIISDIHELDLSVLVKIDSMLEWSFTLNMTWFCINLFRLYIDPIDKFLRIHCSNGLHWYSFKN